VKALTVRQPWASLVALGVKTIETRPWSTRYRGPLAIHAGVKPPKRGPYDGKSGEAVGDWMPLALCDGTWKVEHRASGVPGAPDDHPLPLGAVVATCTLADVVPIVEREWLPEGFIGTRQDVLAVLPLDHPAAPGIHLWSGGEFVADASDQLPYGDFTPGRYAWLLEDITPIEPVPAKGKQGLWTWTP